MTTATLTPPATPVAQAGPKPYRFTIEAYRTLGVTGLFHDMKTMLIDGEILTMTLPSPPHDTALNLTYEFLRVAFPSGHHIRNQQGFDVGTHNDPGPDLAVVVGSIRDYTAHTPTTAVLVIEIADSSLFFDTTTKAELYATAGVSDYWVIDLENRKLLVFRDPVTLPVGLGTTAYRTHQTFGPTDSIAPLAAPTASVRVADLLP
jgi:Uma2 family endonuclease